MKKFKLLMLSALMVVSGLTFAQEKVDRIPKISGFVQIRYDMDFDKDFKMGTNTFDLQRVRLSVDGNLTKNLSYKLQGDFMRQPILVDAYVKYKICDALAIQVGQFKTPFTLESMINPVNLEIYDYGTIIKGLVGYNDVCGVGQIGRDIGIMASGKLFAIENGKGETFNIVEYNVGLFNGNGINNKDNNKTKNIVGRLDIHPWLQELTITGSIYSGMYDKDTINNGVRNRWSAGAQYSDKHIMVRGEYIKGTTGRIDDSDIMNPKIDNYNSNGFYAVAGYNFYLGKEKSQKIMPVVRYERFEQNESVEKGAVSYITAGLNYWPVKSLNCKLNYQYITPEKGDVSHAVVAILNFKF